MKLHFSWKRLWLPAVLVLAVCAAYANHFHNSFHFDDAHTIVQNPYIRSLRNLPKFFTDTTTFSVLPANRTYRPFVSASLAIDYALAHGYTNLFWFHLSTFLIFLLQLAAMHAFYLVILRKTRPQPEAADTLRILSLLAVAWYGLHPAMAETVNYIIQRGDIYSTLGVVGGLALYACRPGWRKTGLYLVPLAFGLLSKPPAIVFPLLLLLYILLFEQQQKPRYGQALLATLPSAVVSAALMMLQSAMTPKSYFPSMISTYSYIITQPLVLLRYFGSLFLPLHLNVDTDLQPFATLNAQALCGFVFVALLVVAAVLAARRQRLRPIAYGLLWFLIASLPTSLYRLSEMENDHRMYMPFVGLILAVVWAVWLLVERWATGEHRAVVLRSSAASAVILLACYGYGVHLRNRVWLNDESLWLDDVHKCPRNGRGLMNYGLTQMSKGNYPEALRYFEQALRYTPNYKTLEINLGVVNGALHSAAQAEAHFQRALLLDPSDDQSHYFYGRWLYQNGRLSDAVQQLAEAVRLNPSRVDTRDLLAAVYLASGDIADARATAVDTLKIAPDDLAARSTLMRPANQTAEDWINTSLYQYQKGNYTACIEAARQALKLRPNYALAYNNIGAAYAGLQQWDLAIENERQALKIDPGSTIAHNNLAAYTQARRQAAAGPAANHTAEDWLTASLRDYQAGMYPKSIQDAQQALRLHPNYAEAYNNIAAAYSAMRQWDQAIAAAQTAIRLKPDFQLAKNNLAWALAQKKAGGH